jgi:uncharacterized protein
MSTLVLAVGLVMVAEGLAFALAPSRIEGALRQLAAMPPERRRMMGLAVLALGVALIWLARMLGA